MPLEYMLIGCGKKKSEIKIEIERELIFIVFAWIMAADLLRCKDWVIHVTYHIPKSFLLKET